MRCEAVGAGQRLHLKVGGHIVGLGLVWLYAVTALASDLREANLQPIDEIVTREIQVGNIPGAVMLIGHQGSVVYRHAFGYRALEPQKILMTQDTIFDLASLTTPIATATAVMQLVKQGKIGLDEPVARYWPEFG